MRRYRPCRLQALWVALLPRIQKQSFQALRPGLTRWRRWPGGVCNLRPGWRKCSRLWCWKSRPASACLADARRWCRRCWSPATRPCLCSTRMARALCSRWRAWPAMLCSRRANWPSRHCCPMPCLCTRWPQRRRIYPRWSVWAVPPGAICAPCRAVAWPAALARPCWRLWTRPMVLRPRSMPGCACLRCLMRPWN